MRLLYYAFISILIIKTRRYQEKEKIFFYLNYLILYQIARNKKYYMYLLSVQNFLKNIFHWFKRKCVKNYESSAKILENFLMSQDVMRHKLVEMIIIILINIIFFFSIFSLKYHEFRKKKENLIKWDFIWHKYSYFLKAICMIRKIHNHIIPYFLKKKFSRRKILKNLKSWFKSWRYSIFERNFKQFKNVFHLDILNQAISHYSTQYS